MCCFLNDLERHERRAESERNRLGLKSGLDIRHFVLRANHLLPMHSSQYQNWEYFDLRKKQVVRVSCGS